MTEIRERAFKLMGELVSEYQNYRAVKKGSAAEFAQIMEETRDFLDEVAGRKVGSDLERQLVRRLTRIRNAWWPGLDEAPDGLRLSEAIQGAREYLAADAAGRFVTLKDVLDHRAKLKQECAFHDAAPRETNTAADPAGFDAFMAGVREGAELMQLDDDVERVIAAIRIELDNARPKFPGNNVTFAALVEEVGEVAKAVFSEPYAAVVAECVQVAVMAIRLATEGDHVYDDWRAARGLDALPQPPGALKPTLSGTPVVGEALEISVGIGDAADAGKMTIIRTNESKDYAAALERARDRHKVSIERIVTAAMQADEAPPKVMDACKRELEALRWTSSEITELKRRYGTRN